MKFQRTLLVTLVAVVSFVSGGWLLQRGSARATNVYQQARLFDDVLSYVSDYYVDSLGQGRLYDLAIDGLLNELQDPYSGFLRPKDFEDLTESTTGNYGGLGIQIDVRDGWITVIAPIAGTPASEAGLDTGDRIVAVDGKSTYGWKNQKAVNTLRGPAGSKVTISVVRPGVPEPIDFQIERAIIHVKAIQLATLLPGNVAYISLVNSTISEQLADELVAAISDLKQQGAQSMLLDLRNNPGGLLDQGVAVSDVFLDPGQVVVSTRGRARGTTFNYRARNKQQWPDLPIVVLVNGYTASAAEIIAGALQDHDRALIVGRPTFGKGVVQTIFTLGEKEALRLTTARWYTPNGRSIQRRDHAAASLNATEDEDSVTADSAATDSTQAFKTDAGRTVYGGGGVRPDLTVTPDTLTDLEQEFIRTLGANLPVYRDVMTSYALELKGKNGIHDPTFRASDAMVRELRQRLDKRNIDFTDRVWAGAKNFVQTQFTYEVTRFVFGREVDARRRVTDDKQIQKALELLKQAHAPKDVFTIASREAGDRRTP